MTRSPFAGATPADNNQPEVMTLSLDEFLRRFRLHLAAQRLRPHSPLSASWLTGGAPLSCRFAFQYSTRHSHHTSNPRPPLPRKRPRFGPVPKVAAPRRSSRDLRLPSSNCVLHPFSPEPPHETTNPRPLLVRCSCPQTRLSASNLRSKACSHHPQTTTQPNLPALLLRSTASTRCLSHHADTIAFA
jgi:hypothetical protein